MIVSFIYFWPPFLVFRPLWYTWRHPKFRHCPVFSLSTVADQLPWWADRHQRAVVIRTKLFFPYNPTCPRPPCFGADTVMWQSIIQKYSIYIYILFVVANKYSYFLNLLYYFSLQSPTMCMCFHLFFHVNLLYSVHVPCATNLLNFLKKQAM